MTACVKKAFANGYPDSLQRSMLLKATRATDVGEVGEPDLK